MDEVPSTGKQNGTKLPRAKSIGKLTGKQEQTKKLRSTNSPLHKRTSWKGPLCSVAHTPFTHRTKRAILPCLVRIPLPMLRLVYFWVRWRWKAEMGGWFAMARDGLARFDGSLVAVWSVFTFCFDCLVDSPILPFAVHLPSATSFLG